MLGAARLACTFINLLESRAGMEFLVDDNPNKESLFMTGSRLPILDSVSLVECGVSLCLLSVAVESEEKVIRNNQASVQAGGEFASIFSASKRALKI